MMPMLEAQEIYTHLSRKANPQKRDILMRFFKTERGSYGEGDQFLGVSVPDTREVAKKYLDASRETVQALLDSPWHEMRLCALLILVERFKRSKEEAEREELYHYYLSQTSRINNWDLVDLSCYKIVGEILLHRDHGELQRLAKSDNLWEQRIAVVSTMTFIRKGYFATTISLAEQLLYHPHDLMQKATGWMLREVGKRDLRPLVAFLDKYAESMPRTTLRYAIEKLPEEQRKHYLGLKKSKDL